MIDTGADVRGLCCWRGGGSSIGTAITAICRLSYSEKGYMLVAQSSRVVRPPERALSLERFASGEAVIELNDEENQLVAVRS